MENIKLSKSKIFLILCLAFICGVFLGRFIVDRRIMVLMAMIFILLISVNWSSRLWRVAGFAGLLVVAGIFRWGQSTVQTDIERFYGQEHMIEGVVSEEPDLREDKTFLTLAEVSLSGVKTQEKILVYTERFPEYEYGDRLQFEDSLEEPRGAEVKGEFSYKDYLSRYGISGLVYYPQIELLAERQGNVLKYYILGIKQSFVSGLSRSLPEPHNSFLAGILVGARRGMPDELLEKFSLTGTTHIIAISGFNITIIAWAIDRLLQRYGRRVSFLVSLLCIFLFVILTGAQSSVVRAAIMGSLGLIALNVGRLYAITNALVFTGAVMLVLNPKIAHFDIGFQLSFLALMGLVYLSPRIEARLRFLPKIVRLPLSATLAAQIFTLPILVYNFDRLSIISTMTNVLVLPAIPLAMGLGFFAGLGSLTIPFIGTGLSWVTWLILEYVIRMVEFTSRLPLASLDMKIPAWFISAYYVFMALGFVYLKYQDKAAEADKWKITPKQQSSIS